MTGLKMSLPIMTGYVPVAIAYAALALAAGLTPLQTVAMSLFVYTGAGQMAAAGMIAQGLSLASIVIAVFVMNLRHIIMSTVIMERFRHLPLATRVLMSLGITDEVFALETAGPAVRKSPACFAGIAVGAWASWVLGTVIGCLVTAVLPETVTAALGVALYAMFISILVPSLKAHTRLLIPVAVSAALSCLIGSSQGIIIGSLGGALVGLFTVKDEDLA